MDVYNLSRTVVIHSFFALYPQRLPRPTSLVSLELSTSLKDSGRYESKCVQQRRRNHAMRVRISILTICTVP